MWMKKLLMQRVMKLIILLMMQTNPVKKEVEIAVPLKYLSNWRTVDMENCRHELYWRTVDMPLINCEVFLILTSSREYVITSMERRVITVR